MNDADIDATIEGVKRARKSPKPYAFYFLAADDTGKAALFVGKKPAETKKTGKEAKKTGDDKKFMFGKVRALPNGTLTFAAVEGSAKPKQVQKAFRLELAKHPGFKKIKSYLMSAVVGDLAEIDAMFAAPPTSDDTTGGDTGASPDSTGGDAQALETAMARAKKAFQDARERLGDDHPEFLALDALRKQAGVLAKQGGADAIDAFDDLADAAEAAGSDDDGATAPTLDVDVNAELSAWRNAIEAVESGISALQNQLKNEKDPDLREIAEFGLNGLTRQHKVPMVSALMDAAKATGEDRFDAWTRAQAAAEAFLNHLKTERAFDAIDNNPFGVDVKVRATLEPALRRIIAT